ncbi:hypothetical protein VPNG_03383 [Cytospora leucostoma]|uniref:Uncharacterized protein n=1 Tax=Cytospora leucostoma TaxID=1230097 RepID=A0A423XFG9_9PEZI|nr:hypothetical protein VPNG_03383 [Cytospora leucostoma]
MPASTISRLFKTPPHGKKESPTPDLAGDISPPAATSLFHPDQGTSPDPLPKLVLPSFDPLSDVGVKYNIEAPGKDIQASDAGQTRFPGLKVAKYNMKCDMYYPSVPWEPSRTEQFDDATAALSNFCLNTVLKEDRTYSNIILWTSYTPRGEPSKRQQRFTVLPSYMKPDRNTLCRDDKYDWAIIVFRDEAKYDAMLRHGIAGFSADETEILYGALQRLRVKQLRSEDSESTYTEQDDRTESKAHYNDGPGSDAESDFNGFLEHQEESIAPAASDDRFDFSGDSEDLDMASRLGGETLQ